MQDCKAFKTEDFDASSRLGSVVSETHAELQVEVPSCWTQTGRTLIAEVNGYPRIVSLDVPYNVLTLTHQSITIFFSITTMATEDYLFKLGVTPSTLAGSCCVFLEHSSYLLCFCGRRTA